MIVTNQRMETAVERTVRRKLFYRLLGQWVVFFGLFVLLSVALEFLYGPPQRPSLDLIRQSFGRHGLMFAAVLALAPIAIRDALKGSMHVIRPHLKEPESRQTSVEMQSLLEHNGSVEYQVERLHQIVMSGTEATDEKPAPVTTQESAATKPAELVGT